MQRRRSACLRDKYPATARASCNSWNMASGVEEKLIGGGKKENYVSSSDSDQDDHAHRVAPPRTDGLPQVGSVIDLTIDYISLWCPGLIGG